MLTVFFTRAAEFHSSESHTLNLMATFCYEDANTAKIILVSTKHCTGMKKKPKQRQLSHCSADL